MYKKIKSELREIIDIVNACPEPFQEKCFEILMNHLLAEKPKKQEQHQAANSNTQQEKSERIAEDLVQDKAINNGEEISLLGLHIKVRKVLENGSIDQSKLNDLYYKEEEQILPLYEDLGTNQSSQSQIRISLLSALENAFHNGEFEFNVETVRDRCKDLKCYDNKNFISYFKKSNELFEEGAEFKKNNIVKLSKEGKVRLTEILKLIK